MARGRAALAYVGILVFAILLIIMGFEGSLGRMLCVVFAPGRLTVHENGQSEQASATPTEQASSSSSGGKGR